MAFEWLKSLPKRKKKAIKKFEIRIFAAGSKHPDLTYGTWETEEKAGDFLMRKLKPCFPQGTRFEIFKNEK